MSLTATQSVLVYDRIAQNRRKTILLVAVAILSVVPFVGLLSYGTAEFTLAQFGHRPISRSEFDRVKQELERPRAGVRTEYEQELDRELEAQFSKIQRQHEENQQLRAKLTWVFSGAVTLFLGLLFWSMASSPTSQVLAMCGARPAGPAEEEAKRVLENLSIGAGLPVPKLYVIDSPVPNAFAAGMDPSRSVIAVTHGLLALLDHRELEGVLAHEISHIGNRDTRLNTVVTAIALFLRLPYLMWQRRRKEKEAAQFRSSWSPVRRRLRVPYSLAMLPIFIYVFLIAPLLAAVIRAAISRSREYQADADAALLTRYPEGLLRALAKIRGAGSALAGSNAVISHLYFADPSKAGALMSLFRGNLLATHPPVEDRINRLLEFNGGVIAISALESAARQGADFTRDHPAIATPGTAATMGQDELSVLTTGNPMGRVFRVLSDATIYDQPDLTSRSITKVKAGALLVVFDDPGKFRQVLTHDQDFGYLPSAIKLQKVDMLPAEIHDPAARAAAISGLPPIGASATSSRTPVAQSAQVAATAVAQSTASSKLSPSQVAIAAGIFILVFMGLFMVLLKFGS